MSEQDPTRRTTLGPKLRRILGGVLISTGVLGIARPDIPLYLQQKIKEYSDGPEPTTGALPFPDVDITLPSAIPSSGPVYPGGMLGSFDWPALGIKSSEPETLSSLSDAPQGSHAVGTVETMADACSPKGITTVYAHSSIESGRALLPPDIIKQIGQKGVGSVITLTTEDGTACDYQVTWYDSVSKKGAGEGTFNDFVKGDNPTGGDLRKKDADPALIFVGCDQADRDPLQTSSRSNAIAFARLIQVRSADGKK